MSNPATMNPEQSSLPNTQEVQQTDCATSYPPQNLSWQTMPPSSTTSNSRLQSLLQALPKLVIFKPLETFTLFPELPKELRDLVWKQVASRSRLIPLHVYSRYSDPPPERRLSFLGLPSILLVSRHVRQEGLRYYQKVTERTFHPPVSVPSSLAGSTSSLVVDASSDSDDSDDSDGTLIHWWDLVRDPEYDDKVPVKRTVYLNYDRDIFSILNIHYQTTYTSFNFDMKDISKIQRLSVITTPMCGRSLVNENMLMNLFNVNSLRVVRVYIEHAWLCRHGILDLLVSDSSWVRWERHIKTKIIKNREDFQDAGLTSNFTFYWKYQGDKTKSSRLASWKIQRKLKQKMQEPEPDQETS